MTYAGSTINGFCDNCSSTTYAIADPTRGVFDKNGNYYFASCLGGNRIRKINSIGIISTVAGNGTSAYAGDGGPATVAQLNSPVAVKFDTSGNMFIADFGNFRIRKVDKLTNNISTIAGVGIGGYNGDEIPATSAQFGVNDICLDTSGNIYVADYNGRRVRKIDPAGIIHTIAGVGTIGYSGDGGPATSAELSPNGITIDAAGNIYIADPYANVVRKINTSGVITTIAGNGNWIFAGDGIQATNAQIQPAHIAIDNDNNIYVGDGFNKRVFTIKTSGMLYCVAGNGMGGFNGDGGPATAASLDYPSGVSIDPCGNLFITEAGNKRIRKVTFNPTCNPAGVAEAATPTHSIYLYPNPTNTQLTITATEKINTLQVTNALGQPLLYRQYPGTEQVPLDVSHLPPGLYILRINGTHIKRFTKQ